MVFEEALVNELEAVDGLVGRVFPLNATEGTEPPFIIYVSSEGEKEQALDGFYNLTTVTCEIHVIDTSYESLKGITKSVLDRVRSFYGRAIGIDGPVIKSVTLDNPVEGAEEENIIRCAFDFTVRF